MRAPRPAGRSDHFRGGEAAVYGVDVTDAGAVRAMVDDVASRWGRIDVLVNNAGRGLSATVEDTKPDEFRALLELNVMAVFTATQAVLPWMQRQGRGHIVRRPRPEVYPFRPSWILSLASVIGLRRLLR